MEPVDLEELQRILKEAAACSETFMSSAASSGSCIHPLVNIQKAIEITILFIWAMYQMIIFMWACIALIIKNVLSKAMAIKLHHCAIKATEKHHKSTIISAINQLYFYGPWRCKLISARSSGGFGGRVPPGSAPQHPALGGRKRSEGFSRETMNQFS